MVESLLSVDILSVSCGNEHVVVVGGNGDVYAWGRGAGGRLGLGNEEDHCTPQKVPVGRCMWRPKCSADSLTKRNLDS